MSPQVKFCQQCGAGVEYLIPEADNRERPVCQDCGFVHYQNPHVVSGAICFWQDQILLCRRAIEPRHGYWTAPAGYMELGETTEEGALREAWEEAHARLQIRALLAVYSLPHIGQVQVVYLADLLTPEVKPGIESLETALFTWEQIPWDSLAFPTVHWALHHGWKMHRFPETPPEVRSHGLELNRDFDVLSY